MAAIRVAHRNKRDDVQIYVGCTPREAVIAAHAQALGDWNTWDYEKKYGHMVRDHKGSPRCTDWIIVEETQCLTARTTH